jgi:hypothetical protein
MMGKIEKLRAGQQEKSNAGGDAGSWIDDAG